MENQETINKLRRIYKESTNETAKAGAKKKLEQMGVSLTDEKPKGDLSQDVIDKLRRIYKESTNETAKAGAKKKLEDAGVSLSGDEPKKKTEKPKSKPKSKANERIAKMIKSWKDEGRSFSNIDNDDDDFFKTIKKDKGEVGVTSQTGNDLLYYNTDIYDNDTDAIRKNKLKVKPKAETKKPSSETKDPYDCDDLIKQAKERKAKAKANAIKRANAPKKTPATKNKEAVEKTTSKVAKSVEVRAKKGEVKVAELEKLIAEYEEAIKKLKSLLTKVKSGKKFAKGGNMGIMDAEDSKEFHKIKDHHCECGGKMENGGSVGENKNAKYLKSIPSERKAQILKNIAKHYAISIKDAEDEVTDSDAEDIYEYIANDKALQMSVYSEFKAMSSKFAKGGLTDSSDKQYSALKSGKRTSRKYASVEMRGGGVYHRRNANQYGKVKGGKTYYEYSENRSDSKRYLEKGGNLKKEIKLYFVPETNIGGKPSMGNKLREYVKHFFKHLEDKENYTRANFFFDDNYGIVRFKNESDKNKVSKILHLWDLKEDNRYNTKSE